MTVIKQIVKELQETLIPYGRFCIGENTMQAMLELENPEELMKPILKIIEENPAVDFGTPGELVLFLEGLYDCGYEELLIESVLRSPTPYNIWMLHRCYNDEMDSKHSEYQQVINKLRESEDMSDNIKEIISQYDWD